MTVSDLSFGPLPSFPETIFHRLIAARGKFLIPPQISGTHLGNYLLSLQASCQFYNHFQCCHVLYSNRLLIIFSTGSTFYTFCIYRMSGPHILSSIHFNAKEKNHPTCLPKVNQALFINGKESNSSTILRAHVSDGSSVSYGKMTNARSKKLHKFSHNTNLAKMLKREPRGNG